MQRIPYNEIAFHPTSYADPSGRAFWWRGQLYRAINGERASLYRQLFDKGIVQHLVNKGLLIETELTSLQIDDYEMVLQHRELPFVSYPYEWCAAMLKDAAITIVNLEMELAQHGLTLQDAHPWNVLFDGPKPLYVDFGSIVPAQANALWPAYDEFCRFFVYPLRLIVQGHGRIARWLLHDDAQGVLKSDFTALVHERSSVHLEHSAKRLLFTVKPIVPAPLRPKLKKVLALLKSTLSRPSFQSCSSRLGFLQAVRRDVESISIPPVKTEWSNYYDDEFCTFLPSDGWTDKHHSVYKVLSDLKPRSLLDIGSNRGWYSQLAARLGVNVVAFDVDEMCVTQLFYDAREKDLTILPLVMDFRRPSPGYGLCNQELAPAVQRLKCDMVIALALVHHLVFKSKLKFDQIVEGLSIFSNKSLLVEFIPREDRYVREWWSECYSWYTLEHFQDALRRHYNTINVLPSSPKPRILLLCEK